MSILKKIKSLLSGINKQKRHYTGHIKFLNYTRGYGFIESKEMDHDVFVHFSDLKKKMRAGDRIKFMPVRESKGMRATQIEFVNA